MFLKDIRIYKWNFSPAALIWFLLAAVGVYLKIRLGADKIGNFQIFKNVFWHTIHQMNLYAYYPAEDLGSYLYGPLFSVIIAPFSLINTNIGAFLWGIFNAGILFFSIRKLPISYRNQNIILLICFVEMVTSVQNMQINCLIASLIILSYVYVQQQKEVKSTLFIVIGFLVKLYGIVGIAFFFFTKQKLKFLVSFILWLVILFCLPMLVSSPSFILHSYGDWYHTLVAKDSVNIDSNMQNISVMGMLGHIFKTAHLNAVVIFSAAWFYLFPLFRKNQLEHLNFQLSYLCLTLIGVVIFSSSAESPTYIIAMIGVAIWFTIQCRKSWFVIFLLVFAILLTSLSATDIFPPFLKSNFIKPYALKALPCFIVWIVLAVQLLFKDFSITGNSEKINYPQLENTSN